MTRCEKCGKEALAVFPVLVPTPHVVAGWNPLAANRVLSRAAHEALGHEIPWGQHPEDDRFQAWCEECVGA